MESSAPSKTVDALSKEGSRHIAARWLEGRSWSGCPFVAVSGLGDGIHIRALLDALPEDGMVFVGVDDPERLRYSCEAYDLVAVLESPRVLIGTGTLDDAFFEVLEKADILRVSDVDALVFAPEYNLAPAYYSRFFTEFARQVDFRRKLFGTAMVDAALWQGNSFANLRPLGGMPDVAVLAGCFRGRSLVLISAGPSLDESIEFVRDVPPGTVIVAVNSSYRAVRHAGIIPHFVFAADPREFTARGFAGVPVDGTWLVTTPIVDPAVPGLFRERVFVWSGSNTVFTEVRRRCGLAAGSVLIEQGTVSACVVDFAQLIGCERVCLVGQDLAARTDGRSHALDSFYTDLDANAVAVDACRWLPGNTLPQVPVEEKLYVYLKTFEQLVARRPALRFLNTARLGARIHGVPFAGFGDARLWLGEGGTVDVRGEITAVHRRGAQACLDPDVLIRALDSTRAYAATVLRAALRSASLIEALPLNLAAESKRSVPSILGAIQACEHLRSVLRTQPGEHGLLESGRTRLELFRCREAQARNTEGAPHWRHLRSEVEFAWAIAEGAWFLGSQLDRLAAKATEVRTL